MRKRLDTTSVSSSRKSPVVVADWQVRRWRRPTRMASEVVRILSTFWKELPNLAFLGRQRVLRPLPEPTFTSTAALRFSPPEWRVLAQSGTNQKASEAVEKVVGKTPRFSLHNVGCDTRNQLFRFLETRAAAKKTDISASHFHAAGQMIPGRDVPFSASSAAFPLICSGTSAWRWR